MARGTVGRVARNRDGIAIDSSTAALTRSMAEPACNTVDCLPSMIKSYRHTIPECHIGRRLRLLIRPPSSAPTPLRSAPLSASVSS